VWALIVSGADYSASHWVGAHPLLRRELPHIEINFLSMVAF
jgi:hypothetical protein